MNFSIVHILKKDFHLTGRYLAVWWALLLFKACCVTVAFNDLAHPTPLPHYNPNEPMPWSFHRTLVASLPDCLIILIYVAPIILGCIVSQVLKADSPIDEKALWRTRPVAGRKMLRAKLLFLGLFVILVPCAIETVVRLQFGFDAGECLRGFVETALIQAAWIAVVASAALLFQKTIVGVLTYAIIAIAGIAALNFYILHFNWELDSVPTPHPGYLGIGTGFIFFTLAVATVLVVAWQIYGGAPRRRGAKILVGGWILAGLVALLCRALFFSGPSTPAYPRDDSLNLSLQTATSGQSPANPPDRPTIKINAIIRNPFSEMLFGSLPLPSSPKLNGQTLLVDNVTASLRWPDPKDQPMRNLTQGPAAVNQSLYDVPAALAAAGYGHPLSTSHQNTLTLPLLYLTYDQFNAAQNIPAQWSGKLDCESGHFVPVANLPLFKGGSWQVGNNRYLVNSLADTNFFPRGPMFSSGFDEFAPANYLLASPSRPDQAVQIFLLYNPRLKECIEAGSVFDPDPRVPTFSLFSSTQRILSFNFSTKLDETGQLLPNQMSDQEIMAWIADARLIVLRFEPDRRFSFTLTIDPFVVPADDDTTAPGQR